MKLKSFHIINFGGLHNFDYTFDEGLNVILQDNGWGKTTMAAFLKAMLYGFDSKRSKDITENERRRYYPWQGGEYGGSLDFEADNVNYRIHRTFGQTPRLDKTRIINLDTHTPAKMDPDKIGETLFSLDASAFKRSIFITQNGLGIDNAASSIHTRLNTLVSQANDVGRFDEAVHTLNQEIKVYEKTGNRGKIGDISRLIEEKELRRNQIENAVREQREARQRIVEIDYSLNYLNKSLDEKKKKLEEVTGELKKKETAGKLLKEINAGIASAREQIDSISEEFGGTVPQPSELENAKTQKRRSAELSSEIKILEEEITAMKQEMEQLTAAYHGQLPSLPDIDGIQKADSELQGVLSTGEEADVRNLPEGYIRIAAVQNEDPEYSENLAAVVRMRDPLLSDIHKLEFMNKGVADEVSGWNDIRTGYASFHDKTSQIQKQLEAVTKYSPEQTDPVIRELELQEKEERELAQNLAAETRITQTEQRNWKETKERYNALQSEYTSAVNALNAQKQYSPEHTEGQIRYLTDLQAKAQALAVRSQTLRNKALSADEEALLSKYPDAKAYSAEANRILQLRGSISANETEVEKRKAVLEGERSKAESLQASLQQYASLSGEGISEVSEPKKPAGAVMIWLGAPLILAGAVLAFAVSMPLIAVSVIGAVLLVLGITGNSRYQTELQRYEDYKAKSAQRAEAEGRKEAIRRQLQESQTKADELTRGIADLQAETEEYRSAAAGWLSGKQMPGESAEDTVRRVVKEADRAAELSAQKERNRAAAEALYSEKAQIEQQLSRVTDSYAETKGKSIPDALSLLRNKESEYKIRNEQAVNAQKNLERFFAENKITEEQISNETSPAAQAAEEQISKLKEQEIRLRESRIPYDTAYPEIASLSYEKALETLRAGKSEYSVRKAQLDTALENEEKYVAGTSFTKEQLTLEGSPRLADLSAEKNAASLKLKDRISFCNQSLSKIGLTLNETNVSEVLHQADEILRVYKEQENRSRDAAARTEKKQEQIRALQSRVATLLPVLKDRYSDKDLPERLVLVRGDIQKADNLNRETAEKEHRLVTAREAQLKAEEQFKQFCETYIHFVPAADNVLSEAEERMNRLNTLAETVRQSEIQKQSLTEQNKVMDQTQGGETEESLRFAVQIDEKRRDELRDEYTQKTDLIRQADQAAAVYPDLLTEIHQLYEQKQKAQNRVSMLKHTVELIIKAKENLAGRYLSKVEQLFNNYMHLWLENETVRGILDIDFNVTIEEDDKVHSAEGYSTGYCDLIDFCMRLALVDTLFEKEQPFLVLDDPFVNLDEEHLNKALELVRIMASDRQIVYFLCHPIRAVETKVDESAREEYVKLAEETRKMLEQRKSAPAAVKKPAVTSPKERYRVSPDRACGIELAKTPKPIINNIFYLDFRLKPDNVKDTAYELFFIDAKGHVLNERQIIEINNGSLSTERVLFNLNTRDDSGDQYELMIQETSQDDYEVAARIPFDVKLVFTGTFAFDF